MLKARDIMKREIVSVRPEMDVVELGRLFIEREVTGMPVIDEGGRLLGVVTENDLISQSKRLHIPTVLRIFDAFIPLEGYSDMEKEIKRMSASRVADICTRDVSTITEDTPLDEIATIMTERNMHHLPVVRDGAVVGMVCKHDLIKGIAGEVKEPGA